jgi:DNA-binding LytR/AlgR family response regulator
MSGPAQSAPPPLPAKAPRDDPRRIGDVWQWLGISGDALGTSGILRRTLFYSYCVALTLVGLIVTENVLSVLHGMPHLGLLEPVIWEGSSWLSFAVVFPLMWIAYRLAPPNVRPRWWLTIHIPGAVIWSFAHVMGFVALRKLAYWALGSHYVFGDFWPNFLYELRKDSFGYVMFIAGCALIERLLRQQQLIQTPGQTLTFDIRDGAKLTRVRLSDILAITSAGNYVEFALQDGRRLLMRSPLSALESDLEGRGFVRTHRSWLVNSARVTALKPEGSGDYEILGSLDVPLSRRFKAALTKLRNG